MAELAPTSSESAGLPDGVRAAIGELRSAYPTEEALLLPALHLAQRHWGGWLPEEAILAVAQELDLPPARVYGVVTFYDLFHQNPVGRHRVRICTNLSCTLRGANEVHRAVKSKLGVGENEVSADGKCSVVEFECLGACEQAPMMMVDDEYHGTLTPASACRILEELD
ncbi:MAG: NADH-quinone oxidoreductase subunit NuoE [Thermoanaerobaculia bacterium]